MTENERAEKGFILYENYFNSKTEEECAKNLNKLVTFYSNCVGEIIGCQYFELPIMAAIFEEYIKVMKRSFDKGNASLYVGFKELFESTGYSNNYLCAAIMPNIGQSDKRKED